MITDEQASEIHDLIKSITHKSDSHTKFGITVQCYGQEWDEVDLHFSVYHAEREGQSSIMRDFLCVEQAIEELKKINWRIERKLNRKQTPMGASQQAAIDRMNDDAD